MIDNYDVTTDDVDAIVKGGEVNLVDNEASVGNHTMMAANGNGSVVNDEGSLVRFLFVFGNPWGKDQFFFIKFKLDHHKPDLEKPNCMSWVT